MGMWARMNDWGTLANAFGIIMTCEMRAAVPMTASVHRRILHKAIQNRSVLCYILIYTKLTRYWPSERKKWKAIYNRWRDKPGLRKKKYKFAGKEKGGER